MINIPSSVNDDDYRYKMPQMILRTEGRGNGVKTNIINLNKVSDALRVPVAHLIKFMGIELGSQTKIKGEKENLINGAFSLQQLCSVLDKFIQKYVLCPKCKYPELILSIRNSVVQGKCDACGEKTQCDNVHKFAAYLIKNPFKMKGIHTATQIKNEYHAIKSPKEIFQQHFTHNIAHEIKTNARSYLAAMAQYTNQEQETLVNLIHLLFVQNKNTYDFVPYVPTILMHMYEADLISEEFLVLYSNKEVSLERHELFNDEAHKIFFEAAAQFFQWLQHA